MSEFNLQAQLRTETGTSDMRRARRLEDAVPAIVYGGDKEPEMLSLSQRMVLKALENEAFYSSILTLDIDGKKEKVILKDIQRHPYKPKVLHMDFFRVSAKEKLTMTVPLHFVGQEEAPGAQEGGVVSHQISEVEVRCLPADLPEFIEVNISHLGMNDIFHLSHIKMPKGVELVDAALIKEDPTHDHAVVSIHPPRKEEPTPEELEAAEAVEGEEAEGKAAAEGEEKPEEAGESKEGSEE